MDEKPPDDATTPSADPSEKARGGHLRVYLGVAAGVGKTYAMLNEGHRRLQRGTDVVIGFVEAHARPQTEAMTAGLEVVPRKSVEYRGTTFTEMDTATVLARHPTVALVDELAHTNVPGSGPHEKRWQDVFELVEAGIEVITTVNIQHLESIADAVEEISGVAIRERVPDWVVRRADQIELVDSSPWQLRRRMMHGNIYPPSQASQALENFFRTDNLIALRELALRFLADETEEQLLEHLSRYQTRVVWETSERILVAIMAAPGTEGILRRASRMAARIKADLHALHVHRSEGISPSDDDQLARLRQLAEDVNAHWTELESDDPATTIIEFAKHHQITQIVIGSSQRHRLQELLGGGSVVRKVSRLAADAGIDLHIIARRGEPDDSPVRSGRQGVPEELF